MSTVTKEIRQRALDAFAAAQARGSYAPIAVAIAAAEERGEARVLTPVPELAGTVPLVLYFPTRADADEFVAIVQEAKPGLVARCL